MDSDSTINIKNIILEFKNFLLQYLPNLNKKEFLREFEMLERYLFDLDIDKYEIIESEIKFQKKYLVSYSNFYVKTYSYDDIEYNKLIAYILKLPNHFLNLIK